MLAQFPDVSLYLLFPDMDSGSGALVDYALLFSPEESVLLLQRCTQRGCMCLLLSGT
ncbi:hypothetical protein [Klebsiella pneumoniae IS10]|nr:hypothetical protein [Klebsiella variicola subsp. variicola]CDK61209.1 hypothetical protein [Klebsiella pneumoniae IS10]